MGSKWIKRACEKKIKKKGVLWIVPKADWMDGWIQLPVV